MLNSNSNVVIYFMQKSETYTIIPHELQEDIPQIGLEAFCIACDFLRFSNSKTHTTNIYILSKKLGISKGRISKGLNSLIKHGYLKRIRKRDEKGNYAGFIYQFFSPKQLIESTDFELQEENNNNNLKNKQKETVITSKKITPRNTLLELFKSYKLEKRVMPQTVKLLREYEDKFDLKVFEKVFESAGNEVITHKFTYIKTVFENLLQKNVRTLEDYEEQYKKFKESKKLRGRKRKKDDDNDKNNNNNGSNDNSNNIQDRNNDNKIDYKKDSQISKIHTRHHDIEQTWSKYGEKELEELLLRSQKNKFKEPEITKEEQLKEFYDLAEKSPNMLYMKALLKKYWDIMTKDLKQKVFEFAKKENRTLADHCIL